MIDINSSLLHQARFMLVDPWIMATMLYHIPKSNLSTVGDGLD
jgi:hypothetical protein